jgi:3-phenylpropionate/trans-cinnamate dioxygenase ferredoxin component
LIRSPVPAPVHSGMAEFERVASVGDVPDGEPIPVKLRDGTPVCLVNLGGEIRAVSDVCTHQDFPMSQGTVLPDGSIECAWHGARFDCRTGAVRLPPAFDPLPVFDVRVEDGAVLVAPRGAP